MGAMQAHSGHLLAVSDCCSTEAPDHMELWKSTFEGIPQSVQQFMALVAIAIFAAFSFTSFSSTPRLEINVFLTRFRLYARAHPNIQTYNALRLAFARGILHPKTF